MIQTFLVSIFLLLTPLFTHAQTLSCLKYQSNSTPPGGYGVSWDVTSSLKELLVKSNCPTSGNSLDITIGKGSATQYIWGTTYVYGGTSWTAYTLTGTSADGGWLIGQGNKTVTQPFTPTPANPLFFVGYVCTPVGSTWKCGCANASCTTKNWQLQGYMGAGGGGGKGIKSATAKIFLVPHNCCSGPIASLSGVANVSTKFIYIPPSQNAVSSGSTYVFDHSLSGINAGAEKAVALIQSRSDSWNNNVALLDFETLKSINLPNEFLPYDPQTQDDWVVWYRTNVPDNLRMAAVRFNKLMFEAMHTKLANISHGDFELGAWGFPNKMKWGDTYAEMQAATNKAKSETLDTIIKPNLSYGAPSVYFSFTPSMADAIKKGTLSRDDIIDWLVLSAKAAREGYPSDFKILPILWPYCFGTCPFDSPVVPPGYMRELANRLLDEAHVDGFSVWRSSHDDDFGVTGNALFSDRWQEVVDVIHERGSFRSVTW